MTRHTKCESVNYLFISFSTDGKKIYLLSMISLLRKAKDGQVILPPSLANATNNLLNTIAGQIVEYIKLKHSIEEEADLSDEWSVDSEQELDETEDARPLTFLPEALLAKFMAKKVEEDDEDEEYEIE